MKRRHKKKILFITDSHCLCPFPLAPRFFPFFFTPFFYWLLFLSLACVFLCRFGWPDTPNGASNCNAWPD
jgi:hypothetical protein